MPMSHQNEIKKRAGCITAAGAQHLNTIHLLKQLHYLWSFLSCCFSK